MANTVSSQGSTSAPRRRGPRHAAFTVVPAAEEVQTVRMASSNEAEDAAAVTKVVASAEPQQATTVVPRRTGPKHFKTAGMDAASAADNQAANASTGDTSYAHAKKSLLQRLLPLAAVLLLAFVVVQASGVLRNSSDSNKDVIAEDAARSMATEATNADAAGAAQDDALLADADEAATPEVGAAATNEAEESTHPETNVDYYPYITLGDGTKLTALREGLYVDEVEEAQVGELVGDASASSFDAPNESAIDCLVYKLIDDDTAYAVQYDGEDSYWLCTKI